MDSAAALLFLLTVAAGSAASGTPGAGSPPPWVHAASLHGARVRRGVLEGLAKTILNPLNLLGGRRGPGSNAHSDSVNVGATLPFGISAGISGSSSDAHSSAGDFASASSSSGGSGYPQSYGGSGSSASAGPSRGALGSSGGYVAPPGRPWLAPPLYPHQQPSNGPLSGDRRLVGAADHYGGPDGELPRVIVSGGTNDRGSAVPIYSGLSNSWSTHTNAYRPTQTPAKYASLLGHQIWEEGNREIGVGSLDVENCGGVNNGCTVSREILDQLHAQGVRERDFVRGVHEGWNTANRQKEEGNLKDVVGTVTQLHDRGTPATIITGADRFVGERYSSKSASSSHSGDDFRNTVDKAIYEVFGA